MDRSSLYAEHPWCWPPHFSPSLNTFWSSANSIAPSCDKNHQVQGRHGVIIWGHTELEVLCLRSLHLLWSAQRQNSQTPLPPSSSALVTGKLTSICSHTRWLQLRSRPYICEVLSSEDRDCFKEHLHLSRLLNSKSLNTPEHTLSGQSKINSSVNVTEHMWTTLMRKASITSMLHYQH